MRRGWNEGVKGGLLARLMHVDPTRLGACVALGIVVALMLVMLATMVSSLRSGSASWPVDLGPWAKSPIPVRTPLALSGPAKLWLLRADVALHNARYREQARPEGERIEPSSTPPIDFVESVVMSDARLWLNVGREPSRSRPSLEEAALMPYLEPVLRLAFSSLTLERAQVTVQSPSGGLQTLDKLDLRIAGPAVRGGRHASGRFVYRGELVNLDADLQPAVTMDVVWRLPAKVTISTRHLSGMFEGAVQFEAGYPRLFGRLEVEGGSLGALAEWLGAPLATDSSSWGGFSAKGELTWRDGTLTLDQADVTLDGQQARGAVSIGLAAVKPFVDGALAFDTLDAGVFLRWLGLAWVVSPAVHPVGHPVGQPPAASGPLGAPAKASVAEAVSPEPSGEHGARSARLPLFDAVDADLRLSVNHVQGLGPKAGRAAVSVTAKAGEIVAEIAELEMAEGIAAGQFQIDQRTALTTARARGALQNCDGATLLALSGLGAPAAFLNGLMTVRYDVAGQGRTQQELLRSLFGEMQVGLPYGGRMLLDLQMLLADARERKVMKFSSHDRRGADFESLDARLAVRQGSIVSEYVGLRSDGLLITGDGHLQTTANRLYMRILMDHGHGLARTARLGRSQSVLVYGDVANPTILLEEPGGPPASAAIDREARP